MPNRSGDDWQKAVEAFIHKVATTVAGYHDARQNIDPGNSRAILFGNIRFDVFKSEAVTNVCLIYETPNGSTNQIMISCLNDSHTFRIPRLDADGEAEMESFGGAFDFLAQHIADIPRQRGARLREYIDSWIEAGMSFSAVLQKLNEMVQQEMKGARITHRELSAACQHAAMRTGVVRGGGCPPPK